MEEKIDISKIKVLQNTRTNLEDIDDLMTDIRENGLLEPIGVWKGNNEFIVAYGHRRFDALKKLGRKELLVGKEVVIIPEEFNEKNFLVLNLSENLHRVSNSPLELGKGCKQLLELGLNISEIASRLSISRTRIETALKLVGNVPVEMTNQIGYGMENKRKGKMPSNVANKIAAIRGKKSEIKSFFKLAKKQELSIRDVEFISRGMNNGLSLNQAVKLKDKYAIKTIYFIVNKTELAKQEEKSFTKIVKDIMKGKIKAIPELLY